MQHRSGARAVAALTALFLCVPAPAQPLAPAHPPITNPDNWARLVRMPAERPLDIVFIAGDSTVVVNRGGQVRAMHEVLQERYRPFATGLMSPGINNGAGVTINVGWDWSDGLGDAQTGAPAPFDPIFQRDEVAAFVNPGHFTRYGHLAADSDPASLYGAQLGPASGLDLQQPLRFQVWYAAGPSALGGAFCPQVRYNSDSFGPYRSLSQGLITEPIGTAAVADGIAHFSAVIPADPTRAAARPMYFNLGGNIELWKGLVAPMTFFALRACDETATKGYAITIADQSGGESDYGMAIRARDWLEHGVDPATGRSPSYDLLIGALRRRQLDMGFEPRILLIIQGMGNSLGESGLSINRGFSNRTPAGVEDNVTDIYNRWEKFRIAAGFPESEFRSLLVGFTVVTDPEKEKIFAAYRRRLAQWTAGRRHVSFLDWSAFMTADDARAWSTIDDVHLSLTGYKTLWRRAIDHGLGQPITQKMAGD